MYETEKRDPTITERQPQIVQLIAVGRSNEEVSTRLGIAPRTAKVRRRPAEKLGVLGGGDPGGVHGRDADQPPSAGLGLIASGRRRWNRCPWRMPSPRSPGCSISAPADDGPPPSVDRDRENEAVITGTRDIPDYFISGRASPTARPGHGARDHVHRPGGFGKTTFARQWLASASPRPVRGTPAARMSRRSPSALRAPPVPSSPTKGAAWPSAFERPYAGEGRRAARELLAMISPMAGDAGPPSTTTSSPAESPFAEEFLLRCPRRALQVLPDEPQAADLGDFETPPERPFLRDRRACSR